MKRHMTVLSAALLLGLAYDCGGGGSSTGPSGASYLNWAGSDNGAVVLDANGNGYHFDVSNGCMLSVTLGNGPAGFCLTSSSGSSTGFAAYGPTNCSNPSSNSLCNSAGFDVVPTIDPSKPSGCIAVLGNGSATSAVELPLAVTAVSGGTQYNITTDKAPSAFAAYWNGLIPLCGSNTYAGSYAGTVPFGNTNWLASGTGCIRSTTSVNTAQLQLTIDGGGIINNNSAKITGLIASTGNGRFTAPTVYAPGDTTCVPTYTITMTSRNGSGKWVLSGTWAFAGFDTTFTETQQ